MSPSNLTRRKIALPCRIRPSPQATRWTDTHFYSLKKQRENGSSWRGGDSGAALTFPCSLSSANVPEMLRLSCATAEAAAAAALTATADPAGAAPRNETLPAAGAAPLLGPTAASDADPAVAVEAAFSANAMAEVERMGGGRWRWPAACSPHVRERGEG